MSGLLIAFDGIDSSGKETQARLLAERLRYKAHNVHLFTTPDYTTASGQELKRRLQNADGTWVHTSWEDKMKLFAANRREHRDEVISILQRGDIVIYDRYVPSSLAFITVEALPAPEADLWRDKVQQTVARLEYDIHKMPRENVSIFLDVPPTVSATLLEKRKQARSDQHEYTDHEALQQRLYNEYDTLCLKEPQHYLRIKCLVDSQLLGRDDVSELVWEGVLSRLPSLAIPHAT